MRIGKGKLVGIAIALALAVLLLMLLRPHAIRVELEPVRTAPLRVTFVEEGRTRLRDRYLVVAPVAGLVRRIELEQGDPVAAGQVVAELEASPATLLDPANRERIAAEVSAAGSARRAAAERVRALRLAAQLAQRELERLEAMGTRSAVSVAQLDAARESAQRARAELAA
ncbi:MAG TPA: hypothetical protein VFO79_14675, partial [Xanthomonadales bacterium]|nr:hypothetical protein [Xanthomonadales bacterium]